MRRFSKSDRLNPHNFSIDEDTQEDLIDEANSDVEDSNESPKVEVEHVEQ